jgi:serine protease Do
VVPGSPAAKAGLRAGDVILKAGGKKITELKQLSRLVADTSAGTQMQLEIYRDGATKDIPVIIGRMPGAKQTASTEGMQSGVAGPHLGLYLQPLTPEAREALNLGGDTRGALVAQVEKGSPADQAGIQAGSVISMVGQQQTDTPQEVEQQVHAAIAHHHSSIILRVEQNGQAHFVVVHLSP